MRRLKTFLLIVEKSISRYKSQVTSGHILGHSSFFSARTLIVFLAFLLMVILLFRFKPQLNKQPVSEGIIGVYTQTTLPSVATSLISDSLVTFSKDGTPEPNLAEAWEVNNDNTVYTFKLKKDLVWNDGQRLKSSDIHFNLPNVDVSYPTDQTIQFKLTDSYSPFPTLLTSPVFKGDSLIGIGKFRVVQEDMNRDVVTRLVLEPTDKLSSSGTPAVIIRFYQDEGTAQTAFDIGEINSLLGVSMDSALKTEPRVAFKSLPNFSRLVAVFYNTKDPILSDKDFRKALNFATPKVAVMERAKTSIPAISWAYNNQLKDNLEDQSDSKVYLDKVKNGRDSTITLTTVPALSSTGQRIVQAWKDAGVNAILRVENGVPQNFQALLMAQAIPIDPDQYSLWHSTQTQSNLTHYSSPRVDKDIEDGRRLGDLEKRKEKYLDLQKVLQDDVPATFLYFPRFNIVYRQKIGDELDKILKLQLPQE